MPIGARVAAIAAGSLLLRFGEADAAGPVPNTCRRVIGLDHGLLPA